MARSGVADMGASKIKTLTRMGDDVCVVRTTTDPDTLSVLTENTPLNRAQVKGLRDTLTEWLGEGQMQYRAGWLGVDGKWHAFNGYPPVTSVGMAHADLTDAVERFTSTNFNSGSGVARACREGRVEIRQRMFTQTEWTQVP